MSKAVLKWFHFHVSATSHTRLRAYDHYTSSTLIGEKEEPVQVHSTLRLRDQWSMYVNARWM